MCQLFEIVIPYNVSTFQVGCQPLEIVIPYKAPFVGKLLYFAMCPLLKMVIPYNVPTFGNGYTLQ